MSKKKKLFFSVRFFFFQIKNENMEKMDLVFCISVLSKSQQKIFILLLQLNKETKKIFRTKRKSEEKNR